MEGLETKILVVGAIYIVFIIVYGIFKSRYMPTPMRSRRFRTHTDAAAGFASSESIKSDRRLAWVRIITTTLVALSLLFLAAVLYFGVKN